MPLPAPRNRLGPLQFQAGALFGAARGGCSLFTSVREMARIGWFWLNRGNWRGAQLLPRSFFDDFMKKPGRSGSAAQRRHRGDDYLNVGSHGGGPTKISRANDVTAILVGSTGPR